MSVRTNLRHALKNWFLVLALLGTGCSPLALVSGSRTAPRHGFEVAMAAGYMSQPQKRLHEAGLSVDFAAAVRFGITEKLDVGLKVFGAGAAAEVRYQLYVSPEGSPSVSSLVLVSGGARRHYWFPCNGTDLCATDYDLAMFEVRVPTGVRVRWLEVLVAPHFMFDYMGKPVIQLGADLALFAHLPYGFAVGPQIILVMAVTPEPFPPFVVFPQYVPRFVAGLGVLKQF